MALNPADYDLEADDSDSSFEQEGMLEEEELPEEEEEEDADDDEQEDDGTSYYKQKENWEERLLRTLRTDRDETPAPAEAPPPCVGTHRCVFCCIPAAVACPECEDEFYCGRAHMKYHKKKHQAVCVPKERAEGSVQQPATSAAPSAEGTFPEVPQDSPLLRLPEEVLLQICRELRAADLVRLGWVCSGLRALCRGRPAWSRARFPDRDRDFNSFIRDLRERQAKLEGRQVESRGRLKESGVLRVAPALHTLTVSYRWPPVSLLRCTDHVQVFELEWGESELVEDYDKNRLYHTLRHYADHLRVVKLDCLHEMKILRLIDGMKNIEKLQLSRQVVKVYPGCDETVTSLELGSNTSNEVAADLLRSNRHSLTSFTASSDDQNRWAYDGHRSPVCLALLECAGLQSASIPTWGRIAMVDSFSQLRSLSLHDFGNPHEHAAAKRFFEASPVARRLHSLSLAMGYHAHRGLIQAVASGCASLRELRLLHRSTGRMSFVAVHVEAPRDLHVILGRLGDLERLTLSTAMVPCTFFDGLAAGALPNLAVLTLNWCGVTSKGRAALAAMQARRADLTVRGPGKHLARANVDHDIGWDWLSARCSKPMCRAASDCDEEDPVSEWGEEDSDGSGGSSSESAGSTGGPSMFAFIDDFA